MNSAISRKIIKLNPSNGWKGLTVRKWSDLVFDPVELTKNPSQIFKSDKSSFIVLKQIDGANGKIPFVVKKITVHSVVKRLVDFFRGPRALRNFKLALVLKEKEIETAEPVAVFWNNRENIYVTEYIPNSMSLYDVAYGKNSEIFNKLAARKAVIRQVAEIVARLHKAGFWHRDSKAGNFIISKDDDGYDAKLIDLDGIKYNFFGCEEKQIRTLANLSKTLIRFKSVNIADFYRGFVIYCNAMGYAHEQSKTLFRKIEKVTVKMRFLSVLEDAGKFKKKMSEQIKKILIIKPSALGDIVLAMPAMCALAENFPNAKIHWFVRPEFAPLLENHKCVHKIIIFNRKKLGKWWCNLDAFKEFVGLIKILRDEKYDVVFDLQGRFRSAIFAWFSGCKKRIGLAKTQEVTGIFYTQKVKQTKVHLVDYFLEIVRSVSPLKGKIEFGLKAQPKAITEIQKILSENNVNKDNYAVIVPGATVDEKKWPVENFAALAEKINGKYQSGIVAVGVKSESETVEKIQKAAGVPVVNLAGKTNIPQLVALLAGAKAVISNDTGPAHIAAALNVPMVLIFGFTNPKRVGPYGRPNAVAAVDGAVRGDEVESKNSEHNIKNVSVESVFELICEQLK
ncbi:MAG: lipopolysaccharide heptosyltransferase I [Planctomycetaceae bacterium]|nr:lipopolysaccharide heptosyltransferase I [Planctomycetaceae bacterium]